ncbi:PREDICTED: CDK5 and ABL1 enzyme substrate 2 [Aptenodytes forsteri]|uniref:CDK5 and ABL1 enzyme substrate 2 n=1 Tax=Aptenodytes forsteri TaxID=9233 RepID=UPI000904B1D0|nr:PREDICTED: CDK5 and ABL1 enzyme substrate 2 [Aptenodytes forsteri]
MVVSTPSLTLTAAAPTALWSYRRRFISQRCSLDFLEDIVEYASVRRTRHISGSPRHKSLKKMHFIKNMRQYDTKNSRIVLICAKRTLCVAFSILPYGESLRISDLKMEGQKQRHPSGGVSVSTEMVLGLEGVELGADGKVVSYAKFLYPTNALVVRKADSHSAVPSCRASASRSLPGSRYKPVTAKTIPAGADIGSEAGEAAEYDPNLLDDPQWPCGKHKRVLIFASYMVSDWIVLICAKRTLCVAFSILPYGESLRISDLKMEGQKQRHPSGGVSVSTEMVLGLEGVELGADGKVVSYAKFLYPTNALVVRKADSHSAVPSCRASASRSLPGSRYKPVTAKTIPAGADIGSEAGEAAEYDPNLLDDPQWPCGKHKRVLIFASYMTTVIEYVKPSDLKKDMNETFREKFPHIKLTLSKIRSLKREMRNLSEECSLEPVTVSMAYVYFEKLVLQGKLNKQNRKLCAGACVLLAAKISSDLRKHEVKHLIDKLEERFRFNRRDLIGFEFTVLVALELALYLPENQVLPHYRRLTQQS